MYQLMRPDDTTLKEEGFHFYCRQLKSMSDGWQSYLGASVSFFLPAFVSSVDCKWQWSRDQTPWLIPPDGWILPEMCVLNRAGNDKIDKTQVDSYLEGGV